MVEKFNKKLIKPKKTRTTRDAKNENEVKDNKRQISTVNEDDRRLTNTKGKKKEIEEVGIIQVIWIIFRNPRTIRREGIRATGY